MAGWLMKKLEKTERIVDQYCLNSEWVGCARLLVVLDWKKEMSIKT